MPSSSPRAFAIHLAALGVWTGALFMTGASAAILFPTMRDLDPALPAYAGYPGAHWSIAAGHAAARIFRVSNFVQWGAGAASLLSLVMIARQRRSFGGRPHLVSVVRAALVAAAVGMTLYHALVVSPRMDNHMRAHWAAAERAEVETARAHKEAFDADHPAASRLLSQTLGAVGIALALTCWTAGCDACARPARPGVS